VPEHPESLTLLSVGLAAAGVLVFVHMLSVYLQNEKTLHLLRVRVNTLRNREFERLQKMQDEHGAGFDVVEDEPATGKSGKPDAKPDAKAGGSPRSKSKGPSKGH